MDSRRRHRKVGSVLSGGLSEPTALIRQHERQVEELDVQLTFDKPITGSGAIMTLPAPTADLKDWIADEREFTSVQRDDWMQVISDFRDSLAKTGPKLSRHVEPITSRIESRLPE